ncbi:LytR/AlgR family response regulator transcription factor [Fibrella forsythiae]|uniref:LytTR family transcriptional regulator n=1 Tax=Fibrella forsythiae TaxID=2817061 RepID=A0ABS3JU13_9BACT|nr:LytTR family DNA-binding domain-containing protein [Fibrella forsythiae]MBO0952891.1 LytTR family transcriptional regulator [Fibrella forsythiae]
MLTACHTPVTSLLPVRSLVSPSLSAYLQLPYGNQLLLVAFTDIVRLEGAGNYTYIYTRDSRRYLSSKTLKLFETLLPGPAFCRVHKSSIINLDYLTDITFGNAPYLVLISTEPIAIARRRLPATRRRVKQHRQLAAQRTLMA